MHCYTTRCGLVVCWQLGQQCTSVGILCDLKPSLGRYKKQNFLNTHAKIFAEVLQNHLQFTQILPFFTRCAIKSQSCQIHFLNLLRLLSLSLSSLRWLKYSDTVSPRSGISFQRDQRHPPPPLHSPEVWIDFHWPWHSNAWTPTQSWSRQFCGGQQIFFGGGVATWWNASHMGTVFSSTPSGSGYWHHGA